MKEFSLVIKSALVGTLLLTGNAWSSTAHDQAGPPPAAASARIAATPSTLPTVLQKAVQAGKVTVLRNFATAKPGLTGYVVRHGTQNQILFGEDGYLFAGQLYSPQGDDLLARYGDQYLPKPDVAASVNRLEHEGKLVVEGSRQAPVLYVFADPNCIFCYRFHQMAEPLVRAGRLQVRWALVGFLKPSSAGRAAAILAAADSVRALQANEAHFDVGAEEGGFAPAKAPSASIRRLLQVHAEEMATVGSTGTPTLLYRTASGQWATRVGLPPAAWLNSYAKDKSAAAGGAQ